MEKKWMLGLALLTVLALYVAASPQAGIKPTLAALDRAACPALLSELECTLYQTSLTSLPPGAERERLIEQYRLTIADRESACSCNQAELTEVPYPRVEQVALKL